MFKINFPSKEELTQVLVSNLVGSDKKIDDLRNQWFIKHLIIALRETIYMLVVMLKFVYDNLTAISATGEKLEEIGVEEGVYRKESTKAIHSVTLQKSSPVTSDYPIADNFLLTTTPIGSNPPIQFRVKPGQDKKILTGQSKVTDVLVECTEYGNIEYLEGIPSPSPVAPAPPIGSLLLAEINVAANATAITSDSIVDKRKMNITIEEISSQVNIKVEEIESQVTDIANKVNDLSGSDVEVRLELKEFEAKVAETLNDNSFIDSVSGVGLVENFSNLNNIDMTKTDVEITLNPYNYADFPISRVVNNEVVEDVNNSTLIKLRDKISVGDVINDIATVVDVQKHEVEDITNYESAAYTRGWSSSTRGNAGVITENGWKVVAYADATGITFYIDKGDGLGFNSQSRFIRAASTNINYQFSMDCVGNVIYLVHFQGDSSTSQTSVRLLVFDITQVGSNIESTNFKQNVNLSTFANAATGIDLQCKVVNGTFYASWAIVYEDTLVSNVFLRKGLINPDTGVVAIEPLRNVVNNTGTHPRPTHISLVIDSLGRPLIIVCRSGYSAPMLMTPTDNNANSWVATAMPGLPMTLHYPRYISSTYNPRTKEIVAAFKDSVDNSVWACVSPDDGSTWGNLVPVSNLPLSSSVNINVTRDAKGEVFVFYRGKESSKDNSHIGIGSYYNMSWNNTVITNEVEGQLTDYLAKIEGYTVNLNLKRPFMISYDLIETGYAAIVAGRSYQVTDFYDATINVPMSFTSGQEVAVLTRGEGTLTMNSVDSPRYSKMMLNLYLSGLSDIDGNVASGELSVGSMRSSLLVGDLICDSSNNVFEVTSTSGEYFTKDFYKNIISDYEYAYSSNTHRTMVELSDGTWVFFGSIRLNSGTFRVIPYISTDSGDTWITGPYRNFNHQANADVDLMLDVNVIPNTNSVVLAVGVSNLSTNLTPHSEFWCYDNDASTSKYTTIRNASYSPGDYPIDMSVGASADGIIVCGQITPRPGDTSAIQLFVYKRESPSSGAFESWDGTRITEADDRRCDRLTVQNMTNDNPLVLATDGNILSAIRLYDPTSLRLPRTYSEFKLYGSQCNSNISTTCVDNKVSVVMNNLNGDILLGESIITDKEDAGILSQFI